VRTSIEYTGAILRWHDAEHLEGHSSVRCAYLRFIDRHTVEIMALGRGDTITIEQAREAKRRLKDMGITEVRLRRRGRIHTIKASEIR
jgi:hypothetical protein